MQSKILMEEAEHKREVIEFLKKGLEYDIFNDTLSGIARFAIDKGVDALSPKQMSVVDYEITKYKKKACEDHSDCLSFPELIENSFDGCPRCEEIFDHYMSKD